MTYQPSRYQVDGIYHVYNRGVAKQDIFHTNRDREHFLEILSFFREFLPVKKLSLYDSDELSDYLSQQPERPLVDMLAYCLMPNHFHLLLRQREEKGISIFIQRSLNSYVRYYNEKRGRVGPLFQGRTKAAAIETNQQLLHVSRYIHLNPTVAKLSETVEYRWSSMNNYQQAVTSRVCETDTILGMSGSRERYLEFTQDYLDYAVTLKQFKDRLFDY